MEETISGHHFIMNGNIGKAASPYMHCLTSAELAGNSKPCYTSKCCADTGGGANSASQSFVCKLKAPIRKIPGQKYDFWDASQNTVNVVWEATVYLLFLGGGESGDV